ncbi:MAG TPA: hypothetical protein ENJ95_02720, partial [Bacteroidetes bacterium]|nr:hypothetical protein [Bacteroidota bacterium]
MKLPLLNAFFAFALLTLPKVVFSQCNGAPCGGIAQWSQDPASACIASSEFDLDCVTGTMPNGGVIVEPATWCTTVENNIFFAFTASAGSASFEIAAFNCSTNDGLQTAILDCSLNFVSPCIGSIPDGTSAVITNTTPFTPGEVYLLMIDGSAGTVCDYIINGSFPLEPVGPGICSGGSSGNNIGTYTSNGSGEWTIVPPSAGVITSPNPGPSATVEWQQPGTYDVCIAGCPGNPPACVTVEIGENIENYEGPITLCEGEVYMCGNTPVSTTGIHTDFQLDPNTGCEIITTCEVEAFVNDIVFFDHVMCVDEELTVCGNSYFDTQFITETCPGSDGCDSLTNVNLLVLNPEIILDEPIETGCGADWTAILSATSSPSIFGPFETTVMWTGPGPIPDPTEIVIEVTVPGEYCLSVTQESMGVTCNDTQCQMVEQSLAPLDPPDLAGPTNVCGGMETYTVSPASGGAIPLEYSWTTPNGEPFTTQGLFSITVDWAGSAGGELCVTADNLCGPSDPTCLTITVGSGPADPIIDGPAAACEGETATYEITNPSAGATCTWTVPTGASFTQAGSAITVDFDGASSGDICVTCSDPCGTTPVICVPVTINNVPAAPTFTSGPNQVCAVDMETYCVNNDPNATSWSWTSPAGNFPDTTTNCLDIDWTGLAGGNICVTANNNCGSSPQTCFNVDIIASPSAVISGQGAFCAGSGDMIDLTVVLTGTAPWTITYTLNGGGLVSVPNIQASPYTLSVAQAGTYALASVIDGGICPGSVSGSAEVIENPLPTATLTGSGNICTGTGDQVDLTITLTGVSPWQVVYEDGNGDQSTLNAATSPFTLPIAQGNAGAISLISVVDNNSCVGTVDGSAQVDVLDAPTTTVSTECNLTNTEYVVTITIENGDPASYFVTPLTGSLSGNVFTSTPIPSGSGYSFVVDDVNNCNPSTVSDAIVVCDCTSAVGEMDAEPLETCGDGPITAFIYDDTNEVFDGDDVQMFVFHSGNSASIVAPVFSVTPTATATFDPATMTYGTTYYMSAVVGNGGGAQGVDLNDPCLQVAQGTPVVFYEIPTAAIAGSTEICEGESADLTITLTGVSPWTVTINGSPVSVFNSPHTHTVQPDSTTDYILTEVMDANSCVSPATGTETVTVNTSPEVINVDETCNGSGTAYVVTFEITGGDPACYSVVPMTGTLTGNIFTSDEIAGGLGYSFEVSDCNGCPSVIVDKPLVDCNCLSEAGNMTADDLDVCGDEVAAVTYEGGEVLDADDALCFILHSGDVQSPIATNSSPDFSFDASTMTIGTQYFICPVVGNDDGSGCVDLSDVCLSVGGCAQVTFREIPTAVLVEGDSVCAGETGTLTFEFTGAGPWTFEYQDDAGVVNSLEATNSPFLLDVSPGATTQYTLLSAEGKFCTATVDGTAVVLVNEAPQANVLSLDCNPTATAYTITIEITGGDMDSYNVVPNNGSTVNGIFTSNPYLNGEAFSFEIDDQFQCGPVLIEGGFNCDCITDAGVMEPDMLNYCIGDLIEGNPTTNEMLDSDDSLVYVLHTSSGILLGTVIDINDEPTFSFDPATMSTGVTYYISAVAGNGMANGMVDLTDFCLSVAEGTPLVFNDLPTLSISGETTVCNGESTDITLGLTGTGPFSVVYEIDNVEQAPQVIPAPGSFDITITPDQDVSYTLVSIEDLGTGCSNVADESVEVAVSQPVEAGVVDGTFEFCDNNDFVISLFENLSGFDNGGTWSDQSGNTFPNGTLNTSNLTEGTYVYTYSLQAEAPCPDDMAAVDVIIHPAPTADAGETVELDCDLTSVQIGGPNTTPNMSYLWQGNVSDSLIAQPTVSEAGEFVLTVTSPFNCTDTDTTYAFISNGQPVPVINISDITCFGMDDGFMT